MKESTPLQQRDGTDGTACTHSVNEYVAKTISELRFIAGDAIDDYAESFALQMAEHSNQTTAHFNTRYEAGQAALAEIILDILSAISTQERKPLS